MYKHFFKRIFDFSVTLIGFLVISPIFLILCALVKIKLGSPIFFKQVRITKGEKPFKIMKFRTMSDARDENGNLLPDEDRFTKFGNFLRSSSLDELPELLNVLKGDMSLVGPRPLYPIYVPYYTKEESIRHSVRAGITGLAQINGRNLCKWDDRFAYDVKYVNELSFCNDIKILWKTFFKVAKQEDIGIPSVEEEVPLHLAREIQQPDKISFINGKQGCEGGGKKSSRIQEIGGDFSISKEKLAEMKKSSCIMQDRTKQYLSTCRSAIREILSEINGRIDKKIAFVPAVTCHVCVEPFVEAGYEVCPYPLNRNLTIDWSHLEKEVAEKEPSVMLVHSYFGFDTFKADGNKIERLADKGVVVIEDLTHGMWGKFKHLNVPYQIGSIRKWCETPDGAFISGLDKNFSILNADKELAENKLKGLIEKGKYLDGSTSSTLYRQLQFDSEELLDKRRETMCMSEESIRIVNSFDWEDVSRIRRENYSRLFELLNSNPNVEIPLGNVNEIIVPFQFPVYVKEGRRELQQFMVANKIFPTIIWACPEEISDKVDDNAKYIYDHILCFHCDHRYDVTDMERIASVLNNYYKNE